MDTIGDALIRIKNGYMARKESVDLPFSNVTLRIANVLVEEGYLAVVKERVEGGFKVIEAVLKYQGKEAVLRDVKRVSKPGVRVYMGSKRLPRVLNGLGIAIVSTPKGVMTDKAARRAGVGGEVMAYIW